MSKIMTLLVNGTLANIPALQDAIGRKIGGQDSVNAWQAISESAVIPTLPDDAILTVQKDSVNYRTMSGLQVKSACKIAHAMKEAKTEADAVKAEASRKMSEIIEPLRLQLANQMSGYKFVNAKTYSTKQLDSSLAGLLTPASGKVAAKK